jgi:multidrug efflux pump
VLARQTLTLVTTVLTLVATIGLYIVIPKGFLPVQDTGLITAVMEAGQDVSFAEMQRLQQQAADVMRRDPDVAGVVSVIGVSPANPAPNTGRFAITLRPRNERHALVGEIIDRLQEAVAPIPGVTLYFLASQDIQIGTRASRAQYQYTLTGTDLAEVNAWSKRLAERLRADPVLREVASEVQDSGLRVMVRVDREQAARLGVSMQAVNDALNSAFGQRQI